MHSPCVCYCKHDACDHPAHRLHDWAQSRQRTSCNMHRSRTACYTNMRWLYVLSHCTCIIAVIIVGWVCNPHLLIVAVGDASSGEADEVLQQQQGTLQVRLEHLTSAWLLCVVLTDIKMTLCVRDVDTVIVLYLCIERTQSAAILAHRAVHSCSSSSVSPHIRSHMSISQGCQCQERREVRFGACRACKSWLGACRCHPEAEASICEGCEGCWRLGVAEQC